MRKSKLPKHLYVVFDPFDPLTSPIAFYTKVGALEEMRSYLEEGCSSNGSLTLAKFALLPESMKEHKRR